MSGDRSTATAAPSGQQDDTMATSLTSLAELQEAARRRDAAASESAIDANGAPAIDERLERDPGYVVCRSLVPPPAIDRALRLLNLEIVRHGLTADEIAECALATFFPHLRWEPEIIALRAPLERLLPPRPDERWGDAQLLLRFPDEASEWPLTSHVDTLPEWAGHRRYRAVMGVALTRSSSADGCLAVWPGSHRGQESEPVLVELDPGDVVFMHPELQHSSTLNRGGSIRYAVYFRLLTADEPTSPPRS